MTLGCLLMPGAELSMPKTRNQALTLSRSPSSRRRLARIARAVRRRLVALFLGDLRVNLAERSHDGAVGV